MSTNVVDLPKERSMIRKVHLFKISSEICPEEDIDVTLSKESACIACEGIDQALKLVPGIVWSRPPKTDEVRVIKGVERIDIPVYVCVSK
jgi:hypothetical protein